MKLQINNIEFNFVQTGSDAISDQDNLGIGHLIMPGNMSRRFVKECGWDDGTIMPHDQDLALKEVGSEHECYNSDTQIVLMHWLFNKRRKYKIDYYGIDPFWICHDSFHAKWDVWSNEVGGIDAQTERSRLIEGAELSKKLGIGMLADTLLKLSTAWDSRWRGYRPEPLKIHEFYKYLRDDEEREIFDMWAGDPESYQTPYIPTRY